MLEFMMFINTVFYFFVLIKIIKQKHPDLIIFSIVNLIIFYFELYFRNGRNLPYIVNDDVKEVLYRLFFMVLSALVLLIRTKNKTSKESLIRILLIFLSTFIPYVYIGLFIVMGILGVLNFVSQ
jgi:hypothetical protein